MNSSETPVAAAVFARCDSSGPEGCTFAHLKRISPAGRAPNTDSHQIAALSAMIVYAATLSTASEIRIERGLADHFGVVNAKCVPARHFDAALRYLSDLTNV